MKHIGQIVILTRTVPAGYHTDADPLSGIYVCIDETPDMLLAISMAGGWASTKVRVFPTTGASAWSITERGYDTQALAELGEELLAFAAASTTSTVTLARITGILRHLKNTRQLIDDLEKLERLVTQACCPCMEQPLSDWQDAETAYLETIGAIVYGPSSIPGGNPEFTMKPKAKTPSEFSDAERVTNLIEKIAGEIFAPVQKK